VAAACRGAARGGGLVARLRACLAAAAAGCEQKLWGLG